MLILIHVIIALASVAVASLGIAKPSVKNLKANYGLIAATVASGTYLLVTTPGHMLEACIMGLAYTIAVSILTVGVHVRLRRSSTVA